MKSYPQPLIPTGHGTVQEIRKGVYELRWRPAGSLGPQRKRRVSCSEKEAKIFLAKEADATMRSVLGMIVDVTWEDALKVYNSHLDAKAVNRQYRGDVLKALEGLQAVAPVLAKVEPAHVQGFLDNRARKLKSDGFEGWATTTNNARMMLSGFFKYLWRMRRIPFNPVSATFPFPETKQPPRDLKPLEYSAVRGMSEPEIQDVMDFLLLTGCRLSEMAKMKHADVDKDGRWTCTGRKGKDFVRMILEPKALAIIRRQPQSDQTPSLVFHKWMPRRKGSTRGHGFTVGAPVDNRWLEDVIAHRCTLANIERFTPHDLRHAHAQWLRAAGVSPWFVQAQLGHSTITTTEIYANRDLSGSKVCQSTVEKILEKAIQTKAV